jgi:hypothetical protein
MMTVPSDPEGLGNTTNVAKNLSRIVQENSYRIEFRTCITILYDMCFGRVDTERSERQRSDIIAINSVSRFAEYAFE